LPGADQIAHRLVCRVRHPDCGQQSASVQHRQAGGVAFVVLLPLAAFAWDHRGGDDHAILPQLGEGAVDAIAARAGFVAELHGPAAGLAQPRHQLLQRRGGIGDGAIGGGLANLPRGRDGDDDGRLVNIHADKSCRLFHDPSSCA